MERYRKLQERLSELKASLILAKVKSSQIEIDLIEYAIAKAEAELPAAYAELTKEEQMEINKDSYKKIGE